MKTDEARLREMLSDDELLIYAGVARLEPLWLSPMRSLRLDRLLHWMESDVTAGTTAWHMERSAYWATVA